MIHKVFARKGLHVRVAAAVAVECYIACNLAGICGSATAAAAVGVPVAGAVDLPAAAAAVVVAVAVAVSAAASSSPAAKVCGADVAPMTMANMAPSC
jgi:hypothetical protein